MKKRLHSAMLMLVPVLAASPAAPSNAGDLNPPPGPVMPTMKTLTEVEPRTPISSLPMTISESGSYYVTKDLVGAADSTGILIATDSVTIDLNGFSLVGSGGSSGDGIGLQGSHKNIMVFNGTVRGWAGDGIDLSESSQNILENLRSTDNGGSGIRSLISSTVSACIAVGNGDWGITAGSNASVSSCVVRENSAGGLWCGTDTTAWSCQAFGNGGPGFQIAINAESGILSHCTSKENGGGGFVTGADVIVRSCVASGNSGAGITTTTRCFLIENITIKNTTHGIHLTEDRNRVEQNHLASNNVAGLKVDSGGNLIVKNSARANGTNYDIAGGNDVGPIGSAASSTSPWANIAY